MEEDPPSSPPTSLAGAVPDPFPRRRTCSGCMRPATVCLCAALPPRPIPISTQIVILHHPHESRHKLATVPLLSKCLQNSHTITNRRLKPGSSPILDSLQQNPSNSTRAIYLFPGTSSSPAVPIHELDLYNSITSPLVLIVFDGTWKHAREMVSASLPFLSELAIRVCLDCDEKVDGGSIYDSDLILRKEPFGGCMSTMEAVARALRVLEPNGPEIEGCLVEVLKAMVRFQACNLKPMKPRQKMVKKNLRNGMP